MENFDHLASSIPIFSIDPSGRVQHGMAYAYQYLPAVRRQRTLVTESLANKHLERALVELHFMLIAVDRIKDGLQLAAQGLGEGLTLHFQSLDLAAHKRARDHFEHIEDRLFGTKKNTPKHVVDGDATKLIHYGFTDGSSSEFSWGGEFFRWSDQQIDVSSNFVSRMETWTAEAWQIVQSKF